MYHISAERLSLMTVDLEVWLAGDQGIRLQISKP